MQGGHRAGGRLSRFPVIFPGGNFLSTEGTSFHLSRMFPLFLLKLLEAIKADSTLHTGNTLGF